MDTDKKAQERAIFDLVYARRQVHEVIPHERPDFLVRRTPSGLQFGVEIAEFYHSDTEARVQRIPGYVGDLLDGKGFRHKDDRRNLDVTTVEITNPGGVVEASGVPAIIQEVPPLAECARRVAEVVDRKAGKLYSTPALTHINLIVRDNTQLLNHLPADQFFQLYFVPELRDAIARSPFREVMFVVSLAGQLRVIRLNMLHLVSEVYLFDRGLAEWEHGRVLPVGVRRWELFASYLRGKVEADVCVRDEDSGIEVIYRDTGILVAPDKSAYIRMYNDGALPDDAKQVTPDLAALLGETFMDIMVGVRASNTFVSDLSLSAEIRPG